MKSIQSGDKFGSLQATLKVWAFGLLKVPMILFISPQIIELTDKRCVVRVPLSRRTKNHLNSMYFGALSAGADVAGGLIAMQQIEASGQKIALIFKEFQANFLKRAEADVFFTCEDGPGIVELVKKAVETGERHEMPVNIVATTPSKFGDEPVAKFVLLLSLKKKS